MKRLPAIFLGFVAVSLSAQVLDAPVAVVRLTETVNIGRRELVEQIGLFSQQLGRQLTADEDQQILDALINDLLLIQAANRAGIRVSQAEIQNYLELQRQQWSQAVGAVLTPEQFRAQVEQETGDSYETYVEDLTNELIKLKYVQSAKADLFSAIPEPTEAEIESFYEEQATSFTNPAMVSFRHIFVDLRGKSDEERAEARTLLTGLYRDIRNGVRTFDEVTRLALDDPRFSAADFGYLTRNDAANTQVLGRQFIDSVFALRQGEIGGVYESNIALHIVRITDRRSARILELDDPVFPGETTTVRQQIVQLLSADRQQQVLMTAVQQLVDELRDEASITIYDENLPW